MLMNAKAALINNNPLNSGVGRYAYSLYKALSKLIDVEFISWEKELFDDVFTLLRILNVNWLYYMIKLRLVAKKLNCGGTLVHVANSGYLASIIPAIKQKGNIIVVTIHDLIPFLPQVRGSLTDTLLRLSVRNIRHANFIICVSESTKKDLVRFIDTNPKKVRIIYYGVDHELFKPRDKLEARKKLKLPLDKPIVLNVGSEEPRKNVPTLLKAFKELLNDFPHTLLVRVGEKTAQTEKLVNKLKLKRHIVYLRPSDIELSHLYNASDAFVFPSYYEGLGLPLLEAMSSGCPVIAGNRSAVPEATGDAGILLDPFDVNGFAYWMREVLTNEDLRIKLSQKGLERSMNFSWEKCARETLEVYRKVLNEV